jgi:2-polyprenyl-3-methyl-5-hydroxy-6-metoxy-1,4-benzoquinol methylase
MMADLQVENLVVDRFRQTVRTNCFRRSIPMQPVTIQAACPYYDYGGDDPPHQPLYLKAVVGFLRQQPIQRVLDVGCGDGNFTASLADAGFVMCGVDLSHDRIARAQASYRNIRFAQASAYDDLSAPFGGEAFDAIVSIEVIEHLFSPRDFLDRARLALRPGGRLILTTPYWGYFKNVALAVTNRMDRALTATWDGGHIKHWSYRTLRMVGEERGFEYVSFAGAGRMPYLWRGMVMVFTPVDR